MSDKQTRWEEIDVEELGRLMIRAAELSDWVDDLNFAMAGSDDDEAVYDARYHAHKLQRLLTHLAVKAEREYHQAQATAGE